MSMLKKEKGVRILCVRNEKNSTNTRFDKSQEVFFGMFSSSLLRLQLLYVVGGATPRLLQEKKLGLFG